MDPAFGGSHAYGAVYTSVLTNIDWNDKENELVKAFLKYDPERLSIHFNVDLYTKNSTWANFTWGRITGAIGVCGKKAPPFFVGRSRMMRTRHENVQNAPFVVDNFHNRYVQHTVLMRSTNKQTARVLIGLYFEFLDRRTVSRQLLSFSVQIEQIYSLGH